jgi:hypothetical protein
MDIPLPPIVYQLLVDMVATAIAPFYAVGIDRDEDQSVNTDVTDD